MAIFPFIKRKRFNWLIIFLFSPLFALPLGLKVLRQFSNGIISNATPRQIASIGDWTYIASDDGLIQFNSGMPELFQLNNRRPVRSVSIDKEEGRIYLGGINEFGYFSPSATESLIYTCLSDSVGDDRNIGNIWGIYPHDGVITLQADNAILVFDTNNGKHHTISSSLKLDSSAWIEGVLWVGTSDGLKFLMGNDLVDAHGAEVLKEKRIRSILPYKEGLLIVTSDGVWEYKNQKLKNVVLPEGTLSLLGEIFSADIFGDTLALGSIEHGLGIVNLSEGSLKLYDESNGLPNNTILSLQFDESGDLWTGMQFGLVKLLLTLPVERLDSGVTPIGSGTVLAQNGDNLYLGTNRGLFSMVYKEGEDLSLNSLKPIEGARGQVWGLPKIGNEIFCCHDRGLFLIKGDKIEQIGDFIGVWDVRLIQGSTDRAYVGTYNGLNTIRKRDGKWVPDLHLEGYDNSLYNFVQESPDVVWSNNADEGINRMKIDTVAGKITDIRNFKKTTDGMPLTADVYISRIDNDIYFSTPNGIYIYNRKNGEIIKDKEITRLIGEQGGIKRVKKTNGSLYALTENEVLQADPAGILDKKRIPISLSSAGTVIENDLFFPMSGDYMAYPSRNGYLFFDFSGEADSLYRGYTPRALINNITVTTRGDSSIFRGNFRHLKYEPVLKYGENSIKIEFGSPEFVERGITYSTRLNNERWSQPGVAIAKEFTDLKEGKYRFEVKALSPNGREDIDYFYFSVLPPWWRTKWMYFIYALLLIGVIFLSVRLEQLRVQRKEMGLIKEKDAEMARRQEEYDRESQEKDRQIMALEREQIDKELKHKAQEVANVMMSLSHKNETLQTVKKELQDILSQLPGSEKEARKSIMSLQSKVVVDLRSDDILRRVEEEFDIVHDNFMKRLRTKYPDLKNNEVLLCAYLKMNLSTKEIAPLLNISPRGVETMRYRLRKKFNLERDAGLTEFLSKDEF